MLIKIFHTKRKKSPIHIYFQRKHKKTERKACKVVNRLCEHLMCIDLFYRHRSRLTFEFPRWWLFHAYVSLFFSFLFPLLNFLFIFSQSTAYIHIYIFYYKDEEIKILHELFCTFFTLW